MGKRLFLMISICLWAHPGRAQSNAVRVMASNGVKGAMEELRPGSEKAIGYPLAIDFNTSASVKQRIESGEPFDAAILTSEVIGGLIQSGKILAASRTDIARSGIGFGIRAGAKKPDVSTPEAVKRTLLKAKSITCVPDGASRVHIERMFDDLGIANEMKSKTIFAKGADEATQFAAEGKAELVLTLISEIVPVRGLELIGPLPSKYQNYITLTAGVSAAAKNARPATALIQFLTSPAAAPIFISKGMERAGKQ